MLVIQLCPTVCDSVDCSLPGSSVHGILQARILECISIPFSRGSSQPRYRTQVSGIAGRLFTVWAIREDLLLNCCLINHSFPDLTTCPLFLHFLISLISNSLSLIFGSQVRPRRLILLSTNMKCKTQRYCVLGSLHGALLNFYPLFSLIFVNPEGNRNETRKEIMFWIEKLIINSAEELNFMRMISLLLNLKTRIWLFRSHCIHANLLNDPHGCLGESYFPGLGKVQHCQPVPKQSHRLGTQ